MGSLRKFVSYKIELVDELAVSPVEVSAVRAVRPRPAVAGDSRACSDPVVAVRSRRGASLSRKE